MAPAHLDEQDELFKNIRFTCLLKFMLISKNLVFQLR